MGVSASRERMLRVPDGAAGKLRSPRVSPRDASVQRDEASHNDAVSNAWIAGQLHLGHVSRVNQCARTAPPDLLRKLEKVWDE